jgi:lambda repressor-like predicted transcriptional regulator
MRRIPIVLLALAVLVGGVSAVAVAKGPGKSRAAAKLQHRGLLQVAAAYLGVTTASLRSELRSGKSLAQVAAAKGKSPDGLKAALVAAIKTKLDAARAAGKLNAAQAARLLARAPQLVERLVNATPRARAPRMRGAHVGLLRAAATYLGLTNPQLVAELRAGKSLAQVATAKGKSVDGLKQALLAALKTKVEAAVAAGRLPAARAQRLLERAPAHIERLVNRSRS